MKPVNHYLAIESSCDDTSVAVVDSEGFVLGMLNQSQDYLHQKFQGVVPEIAYRNHAEVLLPLIDELIKKTALPWDKIQGICVTSRPGLVGALMVGVVTAQSLGYLLKKPVYAVNHLHGHILAPFLKDQQFNGQEPGGDQSYGPAFLFEEPHLCLAVSGGHTSIYKIEGWGNFKVLGTTLDDAAGEALDKFSQMIGLGFPGGALVDRASRTGDAFAFQFAKPFQREDLMMSFSGIKSAAARKISTLTPSQIQSKQADLCASFQREVIHQLVVQLQRAQELTGLRKISVTGGVSANSLLRQEVRQWCKSQGFGLAIPPARYCTDNAAMIGLAGIYHHKAGGLPMALDESVAASSIDGDFL